MICSTMLLTTHNVSVFRRKCFFQVCIFYQKTCTLHKSIIWKFSYFFSSANFIVLHLLTIKETVYLLFFTVAAIVVKFCIAVSLLSSFASNCSLSYEEKIGIENWSNDRTAQKSNHTQINKKHFLKIHSIVLLFHWDLNVTLIARWHI